MKFEPVADPNQVEEKRKGNTSQGSTLSDDPDTSLQERFECPVNRLS